MDLDFTTTMYDGEELEEFNDGDDLPIDLLLHKTGSGSSKTPLGKY